MIHTSLIPWLDPETIISAAGPWALVVVCAIVFAETGLAIKESSPLANTFTMELANGYGGYLPTPEQHAWGGYETWPARSSHLEVEAEPKIRAELGRLLKQAASHAPAADSDRDQHQ